MSIEIRTFLNTDSTALARLWNGHHQAIGENFAYDVRVFEDCVFSKLFFDPTGLLIATEDGTPVGFLHVGLTTSDLPTNPEATMELPVVGIGHLDSNRQGAITALCIPKRPDENEIARQLLLAADVYLRRHHCSSVIATNSAKQYSYYTGLGAGYGLIGVAKSDSRLSKWVSDYQFESVAELESWRLELVSLRTVVDRAQIQIRRTGSVAKQTQSRIDSWWRSVALGHVEEFVFQLQFRNSTSDELEARFWRLNASLSHPIFGLSNSWVFMEMPDFVGTLAMSEQLYFLIAESLKQLQQERVPSVVTSVETINLDAVNLLRKLGFIHIESGTVFKKHLL